jgi:hypothetical protein
MEVQKKFSIRKQHSILQTREMQKKENSIVLEVRKCYQKQTFGRKTKTAKKKKQE